MHKYKVGDIIEVQGAGKPCSRILAIPPHRRNAYYVGNIYGNTLTNYTSFALTLIMELGYADGNGIVKDIISKEEYERLPIYDCYSLLDWEIDRSFTRKEHLLYLQTIKYE